ncbi:hypothetical protein [Bradyrhizobium viridifuturi]|uniref:hypothetical protein n=1 Tax=Bradyrhizobium viridifuturi TaxID=1654716 RepID=UPI000A406292|nr:hypothetical protein [Bradyrhizobium viridifuturi]
MGVILHFPGIADASVKKMRMHEVGRKAPAKSMAAHCTARECDLHTTQAPD